MTRNFKLSEFVRASVRPLTLREQSQAADWARLLQPVRELVGPMRVTSFIRSRGSHATGGAVDVQLVLGFNGAHRRLADLFAAAYLPGGELRQVIFEPPAPGQFRAHVHLASVLVPGAASGYLHEERRGGLTAYVRQDVPQLRDAERLAAKSKLSPARVVLAGSALLGLVRAFKAL